MQARFLPACLLHTWQRQDRKAARLAGSVSSSCDAASTILTGDFEDELISTLHAGVGVPAFRHTLQHV